MRSHDALAALDQAIEKSLWSYLFRGKKTKARYIKPKAKRAGDGEDYKPIKLVRRIGAGGLPIGEKRPFRNSWRGSSRDLYRAARGVFKRKNRTVTGVSPMAPNITARVLGDLDGAIAKAKPLLERTKRGTRTGMINGRRVNLLHAKATHFAGHPKWSKRAVLSIAEDNGRFTYSLGNAYTRSRAKQHLAYVKRNNAPFYTHEPGAASRGPARGD